MMIDPHGGARRLRPLRTTPFLRAPMRRQSLASACAVALLSGMATGAWAAATFYVDGANPACSNSGLGTEAEPYCSISAAVAAHNGPGVTILVKPAVYYEMVTVPKSGAPGDPFILQAQGPGVLIAGNGSYAGITLSGRSWVTVDGFGISNAGTTLLYGYGIQAGGSTNVTISHNTVTDIPGSSGWGIYVTAVSNLLLASNSVSNCGGHGIQLRSITSSVIQDNVSFHNANGISIVTDNTLATGNLIQRNRLYENRGSGLYSQSGSTNNLFIQNLYWGNEHGVQHLLSWNCRHIGEVVWGNLDDGVSLKTNSTGTLFSGCIVVNNGLGRSAYDLYVDTTSTSGLVSDDNVIWNSNGQKPIKFGNIVYPSVAAFRSATGQETRTIQADPRFLDPTHSNFHLIQGSPAIDCGNSGVTDWPAIDAEGRARADDPQTPNNGLGPVDCAERGAFEFAPTGSPPVASLDLIPTGPSTLRADASGSHDADGNILWYSFDFGDGTRTGLQTESTASHTYTPGAWVTTVTVVDANGLVDTASTTFTATPTGVSELRASGYALLPMSPNPMRARGRMGFVVPSRGPVRLSVLDVQGRTVATLANRVHSPGRYETSWNGRARDGTGPGLYFLRLEAPGVSLVQRFVLER